ncbi:NAD(P)-binding protein [Wolfiporia cocos MD-104 SS10]|uniref:D-xylose 1-dehydrogenase (NADP(+), D-xylono-1,5-lactone-forming) n=1 Tax=Wolfiporia cocos (strain MD-104) TaxID=742152 RepID=A0A2H3J9Z3_WOLCO|nr:NAD(P)-binding protein [Wolfiporia cocos MD-104 SS10]
MSGLLSLVKRIRSLQSPPAVPAKEPNALRFGILGAARIGPNALIIPAKSHPDVVVYAVASRDHAKAEAYAKEHSIEKIHSGPNCYQDLVNDPSVDAVYNALPNGLHFEWTMRALEQGKHVLVEKPIADTAAEVEQMVELATSKGLVLLEAVHFIFHPAAQRVKEIVDSGELGSIKRVRSEFAMPSIVSKNAFLKDDVRFNYDLGGGASMDMGVYPLLALRYFTSSDPVNVTKATAIGHAADPARVDRAMYAQFQFPSSVEGETFCDFSMPNWGPFGLFPRMIKWDVVIECERGTVEFFNFPMPHMYHSITVKPHSGQKRVEKSYKFKSGPGEEWWSTYRHQLQAFVDKIRGRTPQAWYEPEASIRQIQCVEKIYAAADMPSRPVSSYFRSSA